MSSSTYDAIVKAAEDYLSETESFGPDASKTNRQIVSAVREKIDSGELNLDVADGTMLNYLSRAANDDEDSRIVSGGTRRGYWLDRSPIVAPEPKKADAERVSTDKGKAVTVLEKDLYPLMELWLQQKGYKSKDTANLKSGGRWGNPDIIGVERVEIFGDVEVELASCEIKLNDTDWERVIFEAISHKRFANRSWFCYRVPEENEPLPKGMEYYAERYKVGVVQIILADAELADLKSGKKAPLDYIERVIERVPALYDPVPLREKRDLIERTGITLTLTF